jgi:hypothetical protein
MNEHSNKSRESVLVDHENERLFNDLIKAATDFEISLKKESERGSAIVCATLIEESLYRLIEARLAPSPEKKDELFDSGYAPLQTFSSKIDLAYRIGLISIEQRSSVHLIRKIRNEFAHSSEEINFESAIVKNRITELFRLNIGILNIFGNALMRDHQKDNSLSQDYEHGMDYIVKNVGWRSVYELLGAILAAAIKLKCNQIEKIKPFI